MDTREVMQMLIEVERALLRHDCGAAYVAVLDAESRLVRLEQEFLTRQEGLVRKAA